MNFRELGCNCLILKSLLKQPFVGCQVANLFLSFSLSSFPLSLPISASSLLSLCSSSSKPQTPFSEPVSASFFPRTILSLSPIYSFSLELFSLSPRRRTATSRSMLSIAHRRTCARPVTSEHVEIVGDDFSSAQSSLLAAMDHTWEGRDSTTLLRLLRSLPPLDQCPNTLTSTSQWYPPFKIKVSKSLICNSVQK